MKWLFPGSPLFDDKKLDKYLSNVFGHEGQNSLLSELIKCELATSLEADCSALLNEAKNEFSIVIQLTEKGEKEYKRVMELVYMFINKIRQEGPQLSLYQEFANKKTLDFDNMQKSAAIGYGKMLARRLNYLHEDAQVDNILRMPYLYETFDSDGIKEYLSLLVPENMWVFYHSRLLDEEIKSDPEKFKREYYYSKDFTIEEVEEEFKEHLKTVMPEDGMRMGH